MIVRTAIVILASSACLVMAGSGNRPNIVWIMAEDIGCDLACYGTPGVDTPVLDDLAAEGLKLKRLYCTSPICSPNRSAMATGMYQTSIDAHHHRSHRADGHQLPPPVRTIMGYLREAGYFTALGCGYGDKTDFNFQPREQHWDGRDWSERGEDQPFFAHIQLKVTHRGDWWGKTRSESPDPVDPGLVSLPPYLPDHPAIRLDWARYLDQVEKADSQVGEILERLTREGLIDRTMIIFNGDNGRCIHRGKGFLYEDGIRVPGIIAGPHLAQSGTELDELVSTIDLSAQVLAFAGIPAPGHMQGRPFLEDQVERRLQVFAARDRWDEVVDRSRAVVTHRYKYIRNDMPEVPWFTFQGYLEKVRPIRPVLWDLFRSGRMSTSQAALLAAHKPTEELYDLQSDPWETRNLADDAAYEGTLDALRGLLSDWESATHDQGRFPEEDRSRLDDSDNPHQWIERIGARESILRTWKGQQ